MAGLKLSSAITRMIYAVATGLLLTHVFACFWFLAAKFDNFGPESWVSRKGLSDEPPFVQYIYALHWAT